MSDYLHGNNLGYLESMFREYMLCFDFGNDTAVTAEGRGSDIVYKYVSLGVGPCSLGPLCKDPDIVLNRVFFGLVNNQQSIALSNFKNPITFKSTSDDYYSFNSQMTPFYD